MPSARRSAIRICEKSWHTPLFCANASPAVVAVVVEPGTYSMSSWSAVAKHAAFCMAGAFRRTRSTSAAKAASSGVAAQNRDGRR